MAKKSHKAVVHHEPSSPVIRVGIAFIIAAALILMYYAGQMSTVTY